MFKFVFDRASEGESNAWGTLLSLSQYPHTATRVSERVCLQRGFSVEVNVARARKRGGRVLSIVCVSRASFVRGSRGQNLFGFERERYKKERKQKRKNMREK